MTNKNSQATSTRVRKPKSFAGELQKAEAALAAAADLATDSAVSKSLRVASLDVAEQRIAVQKAALA